ncbi:NAD(+) diphosphatase [Roseovarius spongiae]|uniref:NAD(+) diphosphatase n=1 Tax=Roseovarius spongiae TaxID=2320272 RepID=A0A3A8AVL1_9RHOB|nr:NAD(+) diphosphatase [Roseovarius spongiae]RKF14600.1 NAD(+) diphosphatase [Roseovarius spongiae]
MRDAETVTFGGSALDRAAELRGEPDLLERARRDGAGQSVLLWRGKPLVRAGTLGRLARLPLDHPVLADSGIKGLLLGREDDGSLVFVHDLSGWWNPPDVIEAELNQFRDATEQRHPDLPQTLVFAELRRIMTRLSPRDAELAAIAKGLTGWHAIHGFCARCGAPSRIVQAGWQRHCDACGGQHFPRTDPVVIMLILHGNSVLMGRSPGWPEGMYSLLAGFIEPGETIEAAVRREVFEESGIRVGDVQYLASQPWVFPASLMLGCIGEALSDAITIDPLEIEHAMWVPREEIAAAFAGQHPTLAPARPGAIAHFLLRNWLADTMD